MLDWLVEMEPQDRQPDSSGPATCTPLWTLRQEERAKCGSFRFTDVDGCSHPWRIARRAANYSSRGVNPSFFDLVISKTPKKVA